METTNTPVPQVSKNLPNLNTHLTFGNFDPTNLNMEEVVNITFLIDTSYSMKSHENELNKQIEDFITWMQGFHQKHKLFLSIGKFDVKSEVLTGLQQVNNVAIPHFDANGGSTHLYEACNEFVKNTLSQQQRALNAGILSKSIFFVITDGGDTTGKLQEAAEVKKLINFALTDESTAGTFISTLVGIGDRATFEDAQKEMGIQKLFVIDSNLTEKENKKAFKEVFEWLSDSVSSASTVPGAINF